MDLCQECGKNEANIHLTQVVNGEATTHNICAKCAKNKGISIEIPPDFIADKDHETTKE